MAGPIPEEFQLKIFDENGVIYDEMVTAVSAENETGPLSILSGHTNFISTIKGSLTEEMLFAYKKDGSTRGFMLESGVIKIFENSVEIYLVLDLNLDLGLEE